MKSFAISAIIAAVSAEAGYNCVQPDPAWTDASASLAASTDMTTCGAACTTVATDAANVGNDYCCFATTTGEDTANSVAAAFECALWSMATVAGANIKTAKMAEGTVTYAAWAWNAGTMAADMTATSADSATMISSAIATIAAIAMIAY
jgi:hypothetical protein